MRPGALVTAESISRKCDAAQREKRRINSTKHGAEDECACNLSHCGFRLQTTGKMFYAERRLFTVVNTYQYYG